MHRRVVSDPAFPASLERHPTDQALVYIGRLPPQGKGRQTGLADRLTGLISLLAACVATDTVFLVDWPQLEAVAAHNPALGRLFVNASDVSRDHRSAEYQRMEAEDFSQPAIKSLPYFFRYHVQKWGVDAVVDALMNRTRARDWPGGDGSRLNVYFAREAHGGIGRAMARRRWTPFRSRFVPAGFSTTDLFGCLAREILGLRPKRETDFTLAVRSRLARGDDAVAIQIRTGDVTLMVGELLPVPSRAEDVIVANRVRNFFQCARDVERSISAEAEASSLISTPGANATTPPAPAPAPPRTTTWILSTDHPVLRRWAELTYPDRVVANHAPIAHTGWPDTSHRLDAFEGAFHELWAMSLASRFVVSRRSGFGAVAAFLSARPDAGLYRLDALDRNDGFTEKAGGAHVVRWNASVVGHVEAPRAAQRLAYVESEDAPLLDSCEPHRSAPALVAGRWSEIRRRRRR